jgi:hypothetical protein
MKKLIFLPLLLASAAGLQAFASVTISSPGNGADVASPFTVAADAPTCSSQPVSTIGYSLDNSTDTSIVGGTSLNAQVSAGSGSHTLHVKAWGDQGAACDTDVAVTVTGGATASLVPALSPSVSSIESLSNWVGVFDVGTSGSATGSTSIVSSPSQSGHARAFTTKFSNSGGARFSVSFGDDNTSTNFFYDGWVYLNSSSSQIANLEMDMNQTMSNGETSLFGFQCDGYTSTWDYTKNAGTPQAPIDQGVQTINATVNSAFALGWAPTLTTNLQVDGLGSGGSPTVYLDNLTISRW